MRRLMALAIVLSITLISVPTAVEADTHTVHPGDNIQLAINAADPGDTIVFGLGTYGLSSTLTVNKSLTLTSEDPYSTAKPVLDGSGTLGTIILIAADNVVIDGLEVANGKGDLIYQGGSYTGTTIRHSVVHDSWGYGDEGIQLKSCTDCVVECNLVYDVAQDGISVADNSYRGAIRNNEIYNSYSENAAIYVYDSYDMTVACNYIHDTQAANGIGFYYNYGSMHTIANNLLVHNRWWGGKHCYDEADGSAVWIYKPRISSIYLVSHNTLDDNKPANDCAEPGNAIYVRKGASGVVVNVDDNIVTNHGGYGIRTWSGASVNYSYNDLWQNALGATDGNPVNGGGNISADPLYGADYTLQSGSPCLGTASDGQDMGRLLDECGCAPPLIEVMLDIKPGSDPNSINLGSKGVVPVAVLTTDEFDASGVDPASVEFAGAAPVRWALEDVDGDSDVDLILHFKTQELDLEATSTEATLTGSTYDGQAIQGTDTVNIVPKG